MNPESIFIAEVFGVQQGISFALGGVAPLDLVQCLHKDTQWYADLLKRTNSGRKWPLAERRRVASLFRTQIAGLIELHLTRGSKDKEL